MVRLHIKRGDQSQFLYDTELCISIEQLNQEVVNIYNGRLKIGRICCEMEELAKHGPMYPPEILGLTEEQVAELKIVDVWEDRVEPSGGWTFHKDPVGRRNGRQPTPQMQSVLRKTIDESKQMISKKLVDTNKCVTHKNVVDALNLLRGAVTIVYPMQLPPHDNISMELSNTEDLEGTQASMEIIEPAKAQLWFAGHQMYSEKILSDYLGTNDKCKVIVKLAKSGEGAPGREPALSEEARKQMMMYQYRRQEELKKLEGDEDDQYLNSAWANGGNLKKQLQGLEKIKFPGGF